MADEKDIQCIRFIDSSGGVLRSTVNPAVTCSLPEGALRLQMNFIPVSVQVINVDGGLVKEFFGQGSAISPVIVLEPVRRKFHKPLTLQIPIPDSNVDSKNLKVLFSISGKGDNVRFEDMTAIINRQESTSDKAFSFSLVCTGRVVLVSCINSIIDVGDTMNDLYRKNITDGYTNYSIPECLMFKAAKSGDISTFQEAVETPGVNINHQNQEGQTALHIACKEGHTIIVRELLQRNADCNICTTRGNTAIHLASYYGHKEIVECLLDHDVDVNMSSQGGFPPVYAAILENNIDIMRLLISRSARLAWTSQDGLSLLLVAVFSTSDKDKLFSMVELLKDSIDLETHTLSNQLKEKGFKNSGEALIHCIVLRTNNIGGKEMLEPLRQKLANLSCSELKEDLASVEFAHEDLSELLNAVKENDNEKFDLIISSGIDINSCTNRTVTALHLACLYGHERKVEMILDLIRANDISSVADCLNQSISLNKQTKGGFTGLYLAAQEGYKGIVTMLLGAGANEKIVNNFGLTPHDIAIEMGHKDIATLLRDSKVPRNLFESASSTDTNNSPAITVNKRSSANLERLKKKEKRKSTHSCQLS